MRRQCSAVGRAGCCGLWEGGGCAGVMCVQEACCKCCFEGGMTVEQGGTTVYTQVGEVALRHSETDSMLWLVQSGGV
jgi:hypothetical protein